MTSRTWVAFVALAALAWGHYGVAAKLSTDAYHHASELTFLLVCAAYTMGAVIVGTLIVATKDHAPFPPGAIAWSAVAGICGAGGAVNVILAMKTGNPIYVMPLVFGPAQAFNALFTRIFQGFKNRPSIGFWASLCGIIAASWGVQQFKSGASLANLKIEPGVWLVYTALAAAAWGLYGVSVRLAVMKSAGSPTGHGSHLKPLLVVCLVYLVFGIGTYVLGEFGAYSQVALERLRDQTGLGFGLLTGLLGFGGAAFVIPANSVKGSPGPILVMALVFLLAAVVNAVGTMLWPYIGSGKVPTITAEFLVALALLAFSGFVFSRNNPNRPPLVKKAH